jgi:protein archease
MGAGHRSVPHTTRFEAWAPNRDQCLAEAVLAMIEGFADTTLAMGIAETQIWIEPTDDDDQLARLLDEIIHRLHTASVLPIDLEVSEPQGGGLDVRLTVAPLHNVH